MMRSSGHDLMSINFTKSSLPHAFVDKIISLDFIEALYIGTRLGTKLNRVLNCKGKVSVEQGFRTGSICPARAELSAIIDTRKFPDGLDQPTVE
jgi:hypothetical protein